jgi:hypothetical protein
MIQYLVQPAASGIDQIPWTFAIAHPPNSPGSSHRIAMENNNLVDPFHATKHHPFPSQSRHWQIHAPPGSIHPNRWNQPSPLPWAGHVSECPPLRNFVCIPTPSPPDSMSVHAYHAMSHTGPYCLQPSSGHPQPYHRAPHPQPCTDPFSIACHPPSRRPPPPAGATAGSRSPHAPSPLSHSPDGLLDTRGWGHRKPPELTLRRHPRHLHARQSGRNAEHCCMRAWVERSAA